MSSCQGVSHTQSHRYQEPASVPEPEFVAQPDGIDYRREIMGPDNPAKVGGKG